MAGIPAPRVSRETHFWARSGHMLGEPAALLSEADGSDSNNRMGVEAPSNLVTESLLGVVVKKETQWSDYCTRREQQNRTIKQETTVCSSLPPTSSSTSSSSGIEIASLPSPTATTHQLASFSSTPPPPPLVPVQYSSRTRLESRDCYDSSSATPVSSTHEFVRSPVRGPCAGNFSDMKAN